MPLDCHCVRLGKSRSQTQRRIEPPLEAIHQPARGRPPPNTTPGGHLPIVPCTASAFMADPHCRVKPAQCDSDKASSASRGKPAATLPSRKASRLGSLLGVRHPGSPDARLRFCNRSFGVHLRHVGLRSDRVGPSATTPRLSEAHPNAHLAPAII